MLNPDMLLAEKEKAQTTLFSCEAQEVRGWLSATWVELRQYQVDQEVKREQFLDQLISEKDRTDQESHKKALEHIKQKHRRKKQFLCIKRTLNRLKNSSLKRLEVPVVNEEGETTGWDVLCTKAAIHDQIVRRNHKHMDQASATLFGSGDGYDALHGLAHKSVMDQIHKGDLKWKDPVEEVNRWVGELQAAYDGKNLIDEVNQIGKAISVDTF